MSPGSERRTSGSHDKKGTMVAKGKSVKKPPAEKPKAKVQKPKPKTQAKTAHRVKPA